MLREGLTFRFQPSEVRADKEVVDCGADRITFLPVLFPVSDEQSKDRANRAKESWVNNVHKGCVPPPRANRAVEEPEDVAPASPR